MLSISLYTKICSAQKIKVQTKLIYENQSNTPVVSRIKPPTKGIHILIPRICDHIISHGKSNFTDVIKDLEMGEIIIDCPDWPNLIVWVLKSGDLSQ